jgi:hypothetical protein
LLLDGREVEGNKKARVTGLSGHFWLLLVNEAASLYF